MPFQISRRLMRQKGRKAQIVQAAEGFTVAIMDHPILNAIRRESFVPLGWFSPTAEDRTPEGTQFVILIGNAGPEMFRRFARERDPRRDLMDDWCRAVIGGLARTLDARAVYPFDKPPLPFLTWARRAKAGHVPSPSICQPPRKVPTPARAATASHVSALAPSMHSPAQATMCPAASTISPLLKAPIA